MFDALDRAVSAKYSLPFATQAVRDISTGSRWRTLRLDNARTGIPKSVFAKFGALDQASVFESESDGLLAMGESNTGFRVPSVLALGSDREHAWLVMEWIDMSPLNELAGALAAAALAALHRNIGKEFGWPRDNFIGATPQVNTPDKDWVHFFQHRRLLFQLGLAAKNRYPSKLIDRGERLVSDLPALFRNYQPVASLLHGDLWGGNAARDEEGRPVIFDPAVYRGDREADLAMSELFGGFPKTFYIEYRNAWPLDLGYAVRKHLYNLYHLLNHANLFAGEYVRQSGEAIERLLAEL